MKFLLRRCHVQHLGWTVHTLTSYRPKPVGPVFWEEMDIAVDSTHRTSTPPPSPSLNRPSVWPFRAAPALFQGYLDHAIGMVQVVADGATMSLEVLGTGLGRTVYRG